MRKPPVFFLYNRQAKNACQSCGRCEDPVKLGGEVLAARMELSGNMVVKSGVLGSFSDTLRSAKAHVLVVPHMLLRVKEFVQS